MMRKDKRGKRRTRNSKMNGIPTLAKIHTREDRNWK